MISGHGDDHSAGNRNGRTNWRNFRPDLGKDAIGGDCTYWRRHSSGDGYYSPRRGARCFREPGHYCTGIALRNHLFVRAERIAGDCNSTCCAALPQPRRCRSLDSNRAVRRGVGLRKQHAHSRFDCSSHSRCGEVSVSFSQKIPDPAFIFDDFGGGLHSHRYVNKSVGQRHGPKRGQPAFTLFEITPVAFIVAIAGGLYLFFFSGRLLTTPHEFAPLTPLPLRAEAAAGDEPDLFPIDRPFKRYAALISLTVFLAVVTVAALDLVTIAAAAFAGAVFLIVSGTIRAEDAYRGLRPEILFLIAGMVVIGLSLEVTGLASLVTNSALLWLKSAGPYPALILLYGATLFLTEILSNAAVAVLVTPIAVALAHSLGVSPRPFLVAVMMAASAAFATPFGYQTNVLVYQIGGYGYTDFVKIGIPLNLLTWLVGIIAIPLFFPF